MTTQEESFGHLYVIGEGDGSGIVKIGRSRNPASRLGEIQVGNPRRVQILLVIPEAGRHENALHGKFSSRHLGGEWFDLGEDDPIGRVQRALDEILRADEALTAESCAAPYVAPPRPVDPRPPLPVEPKRRNACEEAGCDPLATIGPIVNAAVRWFRDNHPDPGSWLLEQGFARCCIEETLGIKPPETSRLALESGAALYEVPSPDKSAVPGIRTVPTCGFTDAATCTGNRRQTDGPSHVVMAS